MKQNTRPTPKTTSKKTNILDETRMATTKGIKDISDTIESGKTINNLLIRKSILIAEIAIRQNEINTIDKKINDTFKKNPINEFVLKITTELEKFESKEITQLLDAIKPLSNLIDISKVLASQTSREISDTVKSNMQSKPKKKKSK